MEISQPYQIKPDHLAKLREYIEKEVFVRRSEQRFFPEGGPWIMDFRRVCLDPGFLDVYTEVFYERFKDRYPFQVGGMEVAAIPLVSAIIMKMRERGMPVNGFFIRKSRKKTGLLKMIEGRLTDDPVILVDDLINNGNTLDRQLKVMEEAQKKIIVFFTLLRFRSMVAYEKYTKQGLLVDGLFSLADFQGTLNTNLLDNERQKVPQEHFSVQWYFKVADSRLEAVVPKAGVVFDEERVYMGSDRGIMFALSRRDGSVVWQHRIGLGPWGSSRDKEIYSTPVLHNGRLYFGAFDGNVYCLDAVTGKRLWVSFEADWISGGLALSPKRNMLYVPTVYGSPGKGGGLTALDVTTGKVVWRTRFASAIRSTPCIIEDEEKMFIGGEDGLFSALDLDGGQILFSFQCQGAIKGVAAYNVDLRMAVFCSLDGRVYSISSTTGLLLWKADIGLSNYGAPCIWHDRVFVCSLDKNLYCLDLKTGKRLWSFPARARIFSSPRIYRDQLYFGANDARMYQINPENGRQIGFFQAVERITNPVIMDEKTGDIFLETYANELLCLKNTSQSDLHS